MAQAGSDQICTKRIFLFAIQFVVTLGIVNYFLVNPDVALHIQRLYTGRISNKTLPPDWTRCYKSSNKPVLEEIVHPFPATVVRTCARNIVDRIRDFNKALDTIRDEKFNKTKSSEWKTYPNAQMRLLWEWTDDFLQSFQNYSQLKTVILPWIHQEGRSMEEWTSTEDLYNIHIKEYYDLTATEPLCTWIETPGAVGFCFDVINNWTCNRDIERVAKSQSLPLVALNAKPPYPNYYNPARFPDEFFQQTPTFVFPLYVIENGVVNGAGEVFSDQVKVVPYSCYPDRSTNSPQGLKEAALYKEVFVAAQSFGSLAYHLMIEGIPRVALFVDFLKRHPSIKIHTHSNHYRIQELLSVLGLARDRIVTGWSRAEIVYLPRASMCTFANIPEVQELSRLYRAYIKKNLNETVRNTVIVIRRTNRRMFKNQTEIEKAVEKAAVEYNMTFMVFKDNPLPSLNETMRLFNSAILVIGPHGAGLANTVFSEPGTYVIEGVCNRPNAFLFFQRLALVLGHRWHGIPSAGGCIRQEPLGVIGTVDISPPTVYLTVSAYLEQIIRTSKT